jgi:serine protease Do
LTKIDQKLLKRMHLRQLNKTDKEVSMYRSILKRWRGIVLLTLLIAVGWGIAQNQSTAAVSPPVAVKSSPAADAIASDLTTAIAKVAKEAIPAVVHIEVTKRSEVNNPMLPFENNPFFHFFFNGSRMPRKFKQEMKGIGSGIIMDPQGHILTNNHVAGGASEINVTLSDGSQYPAKVVGTDPKTDLAVIKIQDSNRLPYLKFGNSDKVDVGEWVVAIGAPRGLDQSVTQGIISAKHRTGIYDPSSYQDFLQTDAPINPGNSGGPLLNLKGEVIGINAAIATESGGSEGIGFAIPSNMATKIADTLIAHGKVERGWLGVSISDVKPEAAKSIGLPTPKGALVADVVKGSPAAAAGLKRGDVVLSYQDKPVADTAELRNAVAETPVGQQAKMTVWRDKKKQELVVKIGSTEDAVKALTASVDDRLGVTLRPITPKEDEKYGIDPGEGVALATVNPKGLFGQAGLEPKDCILQVNGQTIKGVEGFDELMSSLPAKQPLVVLALDHRNGQSGYVQMTLN